ncbi:probable serine/threonine-protein kinase DDB_G0267514 [Mytilus trossulus]|uniref:probable serine/threonine-protein kinase DDB_G0267514 n=1 Tax=Mytilus trossulus TaxID=6551 RepID=UPI0030048A32
MNIIVVSEPGVYSSEVSLADIKQLSKAVQIIAFSDIDDRTSGSIQKDLSNRCSNPPPISIPTSRNSAVQSTSMEKGFPRDDKIIATNRLTFAVPEVFVQDLNINYSSLVGRGAFGTVSKGKWTGLEVAIKAIPITKRAKNTILRTVEKEININSKLRHLNIIKFLAVARTDNTIYLVYEFIMGCNMEDAIFSEETKLDMDVTAKGKLYIMKQVVQAALYMHSLELVVLHHDIKPGNILIRKGCLST